MIKKAIRNFLSRRTFAYKTRNLAMNKFSSYENFKTIRKKAELKRKEEKRNHEVLYFHKVDDPYSHLTIQFVEKFKDEYSIDIVPILVGEENPETLHEPDLYSKYCLQDVKRIAPYYGIEFNGNSYPQRSLVNKANSILASLNSDEFVEVAKKVSTHLWNSDEIELSNMQKDFTCSMAEVSSALARGNQIRNDSDYYFGSAFYYEKELYWGVDRLSHLEDRLIELEAKKTPNNESIAPLFVKAPDKLDSDIDFNLTYYPSLNSPYTFISAKRVKELRRDYPINLITRPVLPMLMRMMTIPAFKAKYIISDAAREGRKYGYEMKDIYSPIGKPARKAYSLFPIIDSHSKGFEYIDGLLKASFQDAINIGEESFLENLVIDIGLDWGKIKGSLNNPEWKKILNDNLKDMYQGNCWGVPSFKLTNPDGSNPFYVWGQDRMWLIKEEIFKRIKES